jgi:Flp pilus assembly pilin Flp
MEIVKSFVREEEGQDIVEYGLLLGFVGLVAFAAIQVVSGNVSAIWGDIANDTSTVSKAMG